MPRFSIVVLLFLLAAGPLPAQQPYGLNRSVSLPAPIPSRERSFRIPFEVRPDNSADPPKEIELLVSTDRGVRWHTAGREPIDAKTFDFKAENDGEYWFAFRTISLSGVTKQTGSGSPQIRVLVDATPPELSLDMKQQSSGEVLVRWKAGDKNLQGKRPDFSVASPEGAPKEPEKNWKPLNVDGRHFKVTETELEGTFLFWPENGVSDLRLRAVVTDATGNRTEKIGTATIKPVSRSEDERFQDALKAGVEKPMTPDERVTMVPQLPTAPPNTAVAPSTAPVAGAAPRTVRIEPPKPVRMPKTQRAAETPETSEVGKNRAPKLTTVNETADKTPGTDPLTEKLLAKMNRFYEGGLDVEIVKKTAEKRIEPPASRKPIQAFPTLPAGPVAPAAKPAGVEKKTGKIPPTPVPAVAAPAAAPVSKEPNASGPPSPPPPASITGVSLNTAVPQPQIIVKWHPGGDPWRDAQVDILRSTDVRGPWFPLATNLPNNGEYWWYLSADDLRPFFVMVQLRSRHGCTHLDATKSAIRVPPQAIGR